MLNRAGRLTLVTSVLSSMPTYHLIVFPLAIWARKQIDKIRRSFLWKGDENALLGKLANSLHAKRFGRVGGANLGKFWKSLAPMLVVAGVGS